MKLINEYLSTKIKDKQVLAEEFPRTTDVNTITEFLDSNGFVGSTKLLTTMDEIYDWFETNGDKSYLLKKYNKTSFWIRIFGGGHEIDDKNPLFVLQVETRLDPTCTLFGTETKVHHDYDLSQDEFIEKINKHFNW